MSISVLQNMFAAPKPVIAMAHFPPLPGTPLYDEKEGVRGILDRVASDVNKLIAGGVDGLLFCNEGDRPYALKADFEAVSVMTRVITEVTPKHIPFGVDFLWDPKAPIAIALATGAHFVREVFTGVYESDMGLWNSDPASMLRYRHNIGADNVKVFYNITPEFASTLGTRNVGQRAYSAVVSSLADGILVSGPMAGSEPDLSCLLEIKKAIDNKVPVFLNTGAKAENIIDYLKVADGVIVGSYLKVDGYTWNPVDENRLQKFMTKVKEARNLV